MNTIATPFAAPQPLVSALSRIVSAVAVALAVTLAWLGAEHASHQAVQAAADTFASGATRVTLPAVEVVGRREPAGPAAVRAGKAA